MLIVLGLGAPNIYASPDIWKTYYKPYNFSIDYPTVNGTANISEESSIVLISIPDFYTTITSFHSTLLDPQEQAVKSNMDDINSGIDIVSEVQPIYADFIFGYGYLTMDTNKSMSTSEMFF